MNVSEDIKRKPRLKGDKESPYGLEGLKSPEHIGSPPSIPRNGVNSRDPIKEDVISIRCSSQRHNHPMPL